MLVVDTIRTKKEDDFETVKKILDHRFGLKDKIH